VRNYLLCSLRVVALFLLFSVMAMWFFSGPMGLFYLCVQVWHVPPVVSILALMFSLGFNLGFVLGVFPDDNE
jgi:hypothetical protein